MYNFSRRWDEVLQNAAGTQEAASVFVRGNKNPGDLDHAEQVMYLQQLIPSFGWHLAARQMADEGFLGVGDELNDAIDEVTGRMLRKHPGVRACWDEVKHTYAHRGHVDALIARAAEDDRAFGDALVATHEATT